ncbi:MAG: hypothetical protein JXQ77_05920 [Campylobacterales bacterium]|nr:hypothetical protein [Campylobacterales bacterium]
MTTVIMIFILPIGIVIYFWDKKNYREALELFESYILKVKSSGLSEDEMIKKIEMMFYKNDYQISRHAKEHFIAEKKHFNIGTLLIMFGLMNVIGLALYLIFYSFILKPRRLLINVKSEHVLRAL